MFPAFDLSLRPDAAVFRLRRAAVDFVFDVLALAISRNGVLALFSAEIAAVSVDGGFFAGEQFRRHGIISVRLWR